MSERCPLQGMKWYADIPEACIDQCEDVWEEVIEQNVTDGEYDVFRSSSDDCDVHDSAWLEGSDLVLQRIETGDMSRRSVGILDLCSSCGEQYGLQSYKFICPYDNI